MYNTPAQSPNYEAAEKKAKSAVSHFWQQHSAINSGRHRRLVGHGHQMTADILFGKAVDLDEGKKKFGSLPVERSGIGANEVSEMVDFSSLSDVIPSFIYSNIQRMGFVLPSPIQRHAIPFSLAGNDLMCCSQTGSGKTLCYLLPIIAGLCIGENGFGEFGGERFCLVDPRGCLPRACVLAPTRELATQIGFEAMKLSYGSNLRTVVVTGGNEMRPQLTELVNGADLIVATPGRLADYVERGVVSLAHVFYFVLDEADRMLDLGFEPQIRRLVSEFDMPRRSARQACFFSATFPHSIQTLAGEFLKDGYIWIGVGRVGSTVENIKQV